MNKTPCKQERFCRLCNLIIGLNEHLQFYINGIKITEPILKLDWDEGYQMLFIHLKDRQKDFFHFDFDEIQTMDIRDSEGKVICLVRNTEE